MAFEPHAGRGGRTAQILEGWNASVVAHVGFFPGECGTFVFDGAYGEDGRCQERGPEGCYLLMADSGEHSKVDGVQSRGSGKDAREYTEDHGDSEVGGDASWDVFVRGSAQGCPDEVVDKGGAGV